MGELCQMIPTYRISGYGSLPFNKFPRRKEYQSYFDVIYQNNNGWNTRLIGLAFAAAVGITLLVLGCALKQFDNWWPMFVLTFYLLVPLPTLISRRMSGSFDTASSACVELCIFLTTGIVVSCLGFPIILARAGVIYWGACALVLAGSIVVFLTILGYFFVFASDDLDYSSW